MKLLVDALIGKFGASQYSIEMLYGNADSNGFPVMPSGIQDNEIIELARQFTCGVVMKNDILRHSACFFDSNSRGSYWNAKFTPSGVPSGKGYVLAYMDGIPAKELSGILTSIKNAVENPQVGGKFAYSGLIHDDNVKVG